MFAQARAALMATLFFSLLLGVGYPLLVTGIARLAFPAQANGSLIRDASGQVVGSRLIAQRFSRPGYLHPRPSAAGPEGYDASASSGSNLGPLNPKLAARVTAEATALKTEGQEPIPADAVTASGSGLDPDISPANALRQAARIAAARGLREAEVRQVIQAHTSGPALGVLGRPVVNVLETNLALDAAFGRGRSPVS